MTNPCSPRRLAGAAPAGLLLFALGHGAFADAVTWTAGDGVWETPANWSGAALPTAADFVEILFSGQVGSSAADNVARELLNHSTLTVADGALTVGGTLDSFGPLRVRTGGQLGAARIFIQATGALDVDGNASVVTVAQGIFNSGTWRVTGGGVVGAESFDNFHDLRVESGAGATANSMINHAAGSMTVTGAASAVGVNGNLTNDGVLRVEDQARLETFSVDNDGGIVVDSGAFATGSQTNAGAVTVTGATASWTASDVVTNTGTIDVVLGALADLSTLDQRGRVTVDGARLGGAAIDIAGGAELTLGNGAIATVTNRVLNRGRVFIDQTSVLNTDRYQQLAGTTVLEGGRLGAAGAFGVGIAAGELSGHGTIDGNLVMSLSGRVSPGGTADPSGRFDVLGDLLLLDGVFAVGLGGTAATDYDVLDVQGRATLGGTLAVSLLDGFVPVLGDAFDIILASSIDGLFGDTFLPALTGGLRLDMVNGGNFLRLSVAAVPLPAPALLLACALGLLGLGTRHRR